jgi:alkylation response protein AidB-like acyl-CoA dehydrogenase
MIERPGSPVIGLNLYEADAPLRREIARRVDPSALGWAEGELGRWGELCGGPIARRAEVIDKNPPRLERYDRWGREVNRVVHHPMAIETKRDLCEAGYIGMQWTDEVRSDPAKRAAGPLLGVMFNYMLCQSDTGMGCSCGMTGGVARILNRFADDEIRDRYLSRLTTMNYADQWDGAMFMTERSGGSDLSNSETQAIKDGQHWLLEGEKWFCSNVDAKAILTLARPEGAPSGTKGLALFLVPSMLEDGEPNAIHIRRIKDKLGTRSVPTAEVNFERTVAYQIGEPGVGINRMMEMVNVSRLGVAIMGLGIGRRTFLEAALHAADREAFGHRIIDYPMVRETLATMATAVDAALVMCTESAYIGGLFETGQATDEDLAFLRILTPLTKIRSTRIGIENAVEAVEMFGGNGYIEDWPTARQLRDAQCHTIWEGTENVNSLDVLRTIAKQGAHEALFARVERAASAATSATTPAAMLVEGALGKARNALGAVAAAPDRLARKFANFLADLTASALLIESAAGPDGQRQAIVAQTYASRTLGPRDPLEDPISRVAGEAFDLLVREPAGL